MKATRIYVSGWAYKKISELSEALDMPMHMIVDEALHLYIKTQEESD